MRTYLQLLVETFSWKILPLLFLSLSLAFMQGVSIALLIPLLDILSENQKLNGISALFSQLLEGLGWSISLQSLLALFILLTAFSSFLKVHIQSTDLRLQHLLMLKLKSDFLKLINQCQWTYYRQLKSSDLQHLLTRDINQINYAFYLVISMFSTIIVTLVYMGLALNISVFVTILSGVVGLVLLFGLSDKVKRSKYLGELFFDSSREFNSVAENYLRNMKYVKSSATDTKYLEQFIRIGRAMMHHQLEHFKNGLYTKFYYELGALITLCGIIYGSITWFHLSVSELVVLIVIFARLLPRFQQFQNQLQQFMQVLPVHERFVQQSQFLRQYAEALANNGDSIDIKQSILFKDVSFHYPNREAEPKWIFRHLSLTIPCFKTTVITGPSGSGKTTLIDMLAGLHIPNEGEIWLDNIRLESNLFPQWRKNLAYVTQDTILFNDTLRNNLIWQADEVDEAMIWKSLELAAAGRLVKDLPQGLNTLVGEQGVNLSGGEKQRIALARALLCQPKILILDEPTNALDDKNDSFIQETIERLSGQLTIVVISHRRSSFKNADQVINLENKKAFIIKG